MSGDVGRVSWEIREGDCLDAMRAMADASVDAVVCDPPYGIGFMGHEWDQPGEHDLSPTANRRFQAWCEAWATEALRVLKPGGHLLAFGGTRTYHRLACAVEDAGFEIRDEIAGLIDSDEHVRAFIDSLDDEQRAAFVRCVEESNFGGTLLWLFGSGFPKSLDVSKALADEHRHPGDFRHREAAAWAGHGTALKPAHEPVVVARKPLVGTVAQNVLAHGTGALNVDGCRIAMSRDDAEAIDRMTGFGRAEYRAPDGAATWHTAVEARAHAEGRWPANVALDEEAARMLDEQTGELGRSVGGSRGASTSWAGGPVGAVPEPQGFGDSGGASRFFYCAKASRAERNAGLDGFEKKSLRWSNGEQSPGTFQAEGTEKAARNSHPTVKPIALMRWLCRLVTPPGGLVLDPFTGSGTTGIAAVLEGFRFVGIEREAEYATIARARIGFWAEHGERALEAMYAAERAEAERAATTAGGQITLEGLLADGEGEAA